MAGRPGRPPTGLVRSKPSPAATGPEGATRRLFQRLRQVVTRAVADVQGMASPLRWFFAHIVGSYAGAHGVSAGCGVFHASCAGQLVAPSMRDVLVVVGADDVGEPSTLPMRMKPCATRKQASPATKRNQALRSPHTQPQCWKEPAGATLVAGSRRRGLRTDKARRGPARTAGRFRETGSRVENPRSKPDPARRAINKRPRTRPFIDGSPQAWPRGWHPPALAPRPKVFARKSGRLRVQALKARPLPRSPPAPAGHPWCPVPRRCALVRVRPGSRRAGSRTGAGRANRRGRLRRGSRCAVPS